MGDKKTELLHEVVHANANLYLFDAVVTLLEGSCGPDVDSDKAQMRIIAICKKECQRQLKRYDRARAALLRTTP